MSSFLSRVAAAPISWGICEAPGWGLQLPVDRVLAEARELGITAMEQGALGWLPTDPDGAAGQARRVRDAAARRVRAARAARRRAARRPARRGRPRSPLRWRPPAARYYVTCPVPALDDWHHPSLSRRGMGRAAREPRSRRRHLRRARAHPGGAPAPRHRHRDRRRLRAVRRRLLVEVLLRHRPHDGRRRRRRARRDRALRPDRHRPPEGRRRRRRRSASAPASST